MLKKESIRAARQVLNCMQNCLCISWMTCFPPHTNKCLLQASDIMSLLPYHSHQPRACKSIVTIDHYKVHINHTLKHMKTNITHKWKHDRLSLTIIIQNCWYGHWIILKWIKGVEWYLIERMMVRIETLPNTHTSSKAHINPRKPTLIIQAYKEKNLAWWRQSYNVLKHIHKNDGKICVLCEQQQCIEAVHKA